jgi:hypothetical protein
MNHSLLGLLLAATPILYQLDYRERVGVELAVPGLAGFEVTTSFETRYRPSDAPSKSLVDELSDQELGPDRDP